MNCPVCKTVKMKDLKRKGGFHKNTKFICPQCGLVKMKTNIRKNRDKTKFEY